MPLSYTCASGALVLTTANLAITDAYPSLLATADPNPPGTLSGAFTSTTSFTATMTLAQSLPFTATR